MFTVLLGTSDLSIDTMSQKLEELLPVIRQVMNLDSNVFHGSIDPSTSVCVCIAESPVISDT